MNLPRPAKLRATGGGSGKSPNQITRTVLSLDHDDGELIAAVSWSSSDRHIFLHSMSSFTLENALRFHSIYLNSSEFIWIRSPKLAVNSLSFPVLCPPAWILTNDSTRKQTKNGLGRYGMGCDLLQTMAYCTWSIDSVLVTGKAFVCLYASCARKM